MDTRNAIRWYLVGTTIMQERVLDPNGSWIDRSWVADCTPCCDAKIDGKE